MNSPDQKRLMRAEARARLSTLLENERTEAGAAIAYTLKTLEIYKKAQTVFIYNSFDKEPNTHGIIQDLLNQGKRVLLPVIKPDGEMTATEITAQTVFKKNIYGIEEPLCGKDTNADKDAVDLAVIPLLAFDDKLNRLGRGKGYYDRYLRGLNAVKVALAFSVQRVPTVPTDDLDIRLDGVITEKEIFAARKL